MSMTATVEKIASDVKALPPKKEYDEFLAWLAEFELDSSDDWDKEIIRDSKPGGALQTVLDRVRGDIARGRTKPLDEFLNDS